MSTGNSKRKTEVSFSEKDFRNSINNFYGMKLSDEQKEFRDAILDKNIDLVMVDAKAGSGKTTIAVGTAVLLVHYGLYQGITYVVSPVEESTQGFRPGTIEEKSDDYMKPLYQALVEANEVPSKVINSSNNIQGKKDGTAFVDCITHTFLRGQNIKNRVVILDECANYYFDQLKKTITRMHDSCKVILTGHCGQCDIISHPERSGFYIYKKALEHDIMEGTVKRAKICKLTKNFRGWISNWADDVIYDEWVDRIGDV